MTLNHLAIGLAFTWLAAFLFGGKQRGFFLFTLSVLAVYALQPDLPIRSLDFYLPTTALGLALLSWSIVTPRAEQFNLPNLRTAAWLAFLILLLGLSRFLPFDPFLTASVPPRMEWIFAALAILLLLAGVSRFLPQRIGLWLGVGLLLGLLILLKTPQLTLWSAALLRSLTGQNPQNAAIFDIRWLGFSYIAFRVIHVLVDSLKGRAPLASLQEYITFVFFYPALIAGPIDRLERFIKDLRAPFRLSPQDWDFILRRLASGLFRKFILADSLALMALNPQTAAQSQHSGWAWVLLYAYALQIYLDFSGYTDLALALGRLAGVRLPENFNQPYRQANLTHFWNNWHMSLTQWFRAYVFNPLTRALRTRSLPVWSIILLTQLTTMSLIGLWHGVTWNFVIWGWWHGLGLFVHNRWQDAFRAKADGWSKTPARRRLAYLSGVLLTFHFVALGWIWFVLPDPPSAWQFFRLLFFWR